MAITGENCHRELPIRKETPLSIYCVGSAAATVQRSGKLSDVSVSKGSASTEQTGPKILRYERGVASCYVAMNTHLVTPRSWSFLRPVGAACWDVNDGVDGELGGTGVFPRGKHSAPHPALECVSDFTRGPDGSSCASGRPSLSLTTLHLSPKANSKAIASESGA